MLHNWKSYATRLQTLSILLAIFLAPSNLFFQLLPRSGYVHGLQIDYLIPKLFATDLLILSSLLLELVKDWETIKHKILRACTQWGKIQKLKTKSIIKNQKLSTNQFSILRSRFSVLSSPPSFLNSQFSILLSRYSFLNSPFSILTFAFYLLPFTFISSQLFTHFPFLSLWTIARLGLFVAFFFLVKNSKSISRKLVVSTFLFSVSIQALWGIGQFFLQRSLTPYWLLGETQLHNQPMLARANFSWLDKLIGTNFGLRVLPYGLTSHPNVLAGFLALGILIFLDKIKNQKSKNNMKSVLSSPAPRASIHIFLLSTGYLLLTITTLFLTQSLSAWLGLLCFFLLSLIARKVKSQITSIFLILLFVSTPILLPAIKTISTSFFGIDNFSITRRVDLTNSAWKMFMKKPLLGVGFNQFTAFVEDYSTSKEVVNFAQPAHHVGLLFLAENGIVGMIILFSFLRFISKKITGYNFLSRRRLELLFTFDSLSPFLFFLLPLLSLDHYLYTLNQGWWIVFIIALLVSKPSHKNITA